MSRRVQTVEQTGKLWKFLMLLAMIACMVGITLLVIGFNDETHPTPNRMIGFGMLSMVGGLAGFMFARIGSWWFHG